MKKKQILSSSCREAALASHKTEYRELGLWEKLKLRVHVFFCKNCNHYYLNNQKLTRLVQKSGLELCTEEEKQRFKENIKATKLK